MDIRTERKKRLMTQYDLARLIDEHQPVISLIEKGYRRLTDSQSVKIRKVFKDYDSKN